MAVSITSFWNPRTLAGAALLELELKANDQLRVIEATFLADYVMDRLPPELFFELGEANANGR